MRKMLILMGVFLIFYSLIGHAYNQIIVSLHEETVIEEKIVSKVDPWETLHGKTLHATEQNPFKFIFEPPVLNIALTLGVVFILTGRMIKSG